MNLGKLFNYKYLKQNIKKSKGLLTLLVLIIPVITSLILIGINSSDYATAIFPLVTVMANLFGMYAIPVILSFLLYGYVFKKNSVDFVGSMPLTRSTIFVTNFIGGLLLILVIQVLTAVVTALGTAFLPNINIASQMILDNFVVLLLAYIFVYSATNVAMTVSGNHLTQIVVTMLIVFLVPFTITFGFGGIQRLVDIELANRQVAINNYSLRTYTLPSLFFTEIFGSVESNFFDASRNAKTIVISIAYFAIGMYLFNKRKMENVGNSFSKIWVHLLVKGITLVPMVFVLQLLEFKDIFYWIAVVLIFIYYCLYDFITNRKVPVKYTIPCFIATFAILFGIYNGMQWLGVKLYNTSISVDDIEEISIEDADFYRMFSVSDWRSLESKMNTDIKITDKAMINNILENLFDENLRTYDDYNYSGYSAMVFLRIKLNNNKVIYAMPSINYNAYKEALDYVYSNQENLDKLDKIHEISKDAYIISSEAFVSKEDTKELIDLYNNTDIKQILDNEREFTYYSGARRNYTPMPGYTVYYYQGHNLRQVELNPFLSQEIFDKLLEVSQKRAKEVLDIYDSNETHYIEAYINEKRVNRYAVENDFGYTSLKTTDGIIAYAKKHLNEKIDMNDSFYILNIHSDYPNQATIYLKETEELDSIIERDSYKDEDYETEDYYYDDDIIIDYVQ